MVFVFNFRGVSRNIADWKLYPICFSVVVKVVTAIIILVSKQLKTHCLRVLKNAIDDALLLITYIVQNNCVGGNLNPRLGHCKYEVKD